MDYYRKIRKTGIVLHTKEYVNTSADFSALKIIPIRWMNWKCYMKQINSVSAEKS